MDNKFESLLENAEPGVAITPTQLVLEKVGESFRGFFVGFAPDWERIDIKTGEMRRTKVMLFFDGKKLLSNMGAQLVRVMGSIAPGTALQITLDELKANEHGGKTKIYVVTPLLIRPLDLREVFGDTLRLAAPQDVGEPLIIAQDAVSAPAEPKPELSSVVSVADLYPNS